MAIHAQRNACISDNIAVGVDIDMQFQFIDPVSSDRAGILEGRINRRKLEPS